jgi:hypothetical protein
MICINNESSNTGKIHWTKNTRFKTLDNISFILFFFTIFIGLFVIGYNVNNIKDIEKVKDFIDKYQDTILIIGWGFVLIELLFSIVNSMKVKKVSPSLVLVILTIYFCLLGYENFPLNKKISSLIPLLYFIAILPRLPIKIVKLCNYNKNTAQGIDSF